MMSPVLTETEYRNLRNSVRQKTVMKAIRGGDEGQKTKLLQMNYSCLPNEDGTLKGSKRMSTTVGMDIDHIAPEEMEAVKDNILAKAAELGLLMLEGSARGKGYHLVFKRQPELSQEDNLKWASELLGVPYDEGAKDITRVFFTTTEKELFYLSDEIFEIKESTEQRNQGATESVNPEIRESVTPAIANRSTLTAKQEWHGYDVQQIIDARYAKKLPCAADSNRHKESLKLASDLLIMLDGDKKAVQRIVEAQKWVQEIIDERNEDVERTVSSAAERMAEKEKKYEWQQPSAEMRTAIAEVTGKTFKEIVKAQSNSPAEENLSERETPPEMPEQLPKLVGLLTSKTPAEYKAAVANAVFPPLATHLCGVTFSYTDNKIHEATLMNCLMAGTGAGKGCIDDPIDHIMADIKARDKENERREAEWKRECQRRGANKDKQVRPDGLVIQIIDPDMTKPALVTRMDEAEGHFVYVKLNELDLFEQLKGQNGKQHFQLMCLAFDPGAEYGQTRVGTQSVTARPQCRFNWNACTTLQKGRRFFRNVLTDGPISRINFCTIPEQEIGAEQPIYGLYDEQFDEDLKPYIDNLVSAQGPIDCPQAYDLAKRLQTECAEFARLSQDEVYWNLSHRACVIAWLKACVLYVANGKQWEDTFDDFIRWSLNYDLWCKMQLFGADIKKANGSDDARIGTRGPRNLLELLPDEFTLEDAKRVRQQQGLSNEGLLCNKMINTWMHRGYVIQYTVYSFKKNIK